MSSTGRTVYLVLELTLWFVLLPVLYALDWIPVHKIIPLLILFLYCSIVLLQKRQITPVDFSMEANWRSILVRFILVGAAILIYLHWFMKYNLWSDFSSNRRLVYMILMYPFLSALPQELIFRKFFFYRYSSLFRNPQLLIVVNSVIFSFAHLYFSSVLVLLFTLLGGLMFSLTYLKRKSLLVVTLEHTLYGILILCTGLSALFYKAF
jgi:membrane protease YdiL (CAAX protease family)